MMDLETERLVIRAFRAVELDSFADLMDRAFGRGNSREAYREQLAFYALGEVVHGRLKQPPYGDRVMRRLGMRVERNPFPSPGWFHVVGVLECASAGGM